MKPETLLLVALAATPLGAQTPGQTDALPLPGGTLRIGFLGHGTLMLDWGGWIVHVDPVTAEADYQSLPKADLILVTHEHSDHLDPKAITLISKPGTAIIANPAAAKKLKGAIALKNGERRQVGGVGVEAVPAYNTTAGRTQFHPRGRDNGYLLTLDGRRVYIAGDTENTTEMKALKDIYVAFLPMNLPYTMTPEQVADAARAFRPQILYPYHFGETDTGRLTELLRGSGIEVRIRDLK